MGGPLAVGTLVANRKRYHSPHLYNILPRLRPPREKPVSRFFHKFSQQETVNFCSQEQKKQHFPVGKRSVTMLNCRLVLVIIFVCYKLNLFCKLRKFLSSKTRIESYLLNIHLLSFLFSSINFSFSLFQQYKSLYRQLHAETHQEEDELFMLPQTYPGIPVFNPFLPRLPPRFPSGIIGTEICSV